MRRHRRGRPVRHEDEAGENDEDENIVVKQPPHKIEERGIGGAKLLLDGLDDATQRQQRVGDVPQRVAAAAAAAFHHRHLVRAEEFLARKLISVSTLLQLLPMRFQFFLVDSASESTSHFGVWFGTPQFRRQTPQRLTQGRLSSRRS